MSDSTDLIFYSRNNFALGEKIRDCLRNTNKDVIYSNNICQVTERIESGKHLIVFIDKQYRVYAKMLSAIIKSLSALSYVRIVFIDDELAHYADIIDNKKVFCIPTINLNVSIQNIVYTCEMLNYRKDTLNFALSGINETISKYLTDLCFSYKLAGFRYIKQSIELGIKNNFYLGSLQKDVYPVIAQQNNTNPFNIESGIRMAIKSAAQTESFKKALNITSANKITNRSFLEFLLDKFNTEKYVMN